MRAHTTPPLQISQLHGRAQLEERVPAEHGGDKRTVGFEEVVDLREERGEVVDPVDGQRREHGVEGVGLVGEGLEIGDDFALDGDLLVEGEVLVAVEEGARGLGAGELLDAFGEGW